MFRGNAVGGSAAVLRISIVLLAVIVVATSLNAWLVVEIRKEQTAIAEIVRGGFQADIERLGSLPAEVQWQLLFTVVVLLVLISAAVVYVFVVRAYLTSQRLLRDTEHLAQDILAGMDHGVVTTDCQGTVTSVNRRARELLGLSSDCRGVPLETLGAAGERLAAMSREVLERREPIRDDHCAVDLGGSALSLRIECDLLRNVHRQLMGAVLHLGDVTERMLMEERMRRMERFIGLGTLAAGLHHEIKNPLSALSLHVQLLEEGLEGRLNDDLAQNLGVLKTEVTRIAGVLESFRDYASVERLNAAPTDMVKLIQQTVDLIRPKAEQQRVEVRFPAPGGDFPVAWVDAVRVEQVLLNLAINAIEEMSDGGTLSFSAQLDGQFVDVLVADTGRGVPAQLQNRIFDPYFTTKSGGTGMGLAYCDKIVRLHGGQIDVETGPTGTVFHVLLPLAETE